MPASQLAEKQIHCYHCGEPCAGSDILLGDKNFCCEGCRIVYQVLNQHDLCDYYALNTNPGASQRVPVRKEKFAFLDDENLQLQLVSFKNDKQVHVSFHLPQMHCSSCVYLLENLHRLDKAVISSRVNFTRKEIDIVFVPQQTSLRKIAELLTSIGYEPYISLADLNGKKPVHDKGLVLRLGVAGFCFANIMLMSFPDYLGIDASESKLRETFRWINFGLAIPVFLYSAFPFYSSSWKSLKQRYLNIDAPIALAIIITFIRSAYELINGTSGGYFDSMSGIVFFMLAGRVLQDRTYRHLSFERDYTSYFPVAVSVLKADKEIPTPLSGIRPGDTLLIHHEELIPADGILTKGRAFIDYSFVTGESLPVLKEVGELVYAGGKQTEGNIEVLVVREVAQSYLTKLWNQDSFKKNKKDASYSFVHLLSRHFTMIIFTLAIVTGIYWQLKDPARVWPAVTAIFIIACPCALLLSNSFTNGSILRILGRNQFYLRNAETIERIARIDHVVFDKTGTLTTTRNQQIIYEGEKLSAQQLQQIAALAACSTHPLSKALSKHLLQGQTLKVAGFKESRGRGIEGFVQEDLLKLGSFHFVTGKKSADTGTSVFVSFENELKGFFLFRNHYREEIPGLLHRLKERYKLSVLTGDNESEKQNLQNLFGTHTTIRFHQSPEDKLRYIKQVQHDGDKVMMIGDGLNDAGALKQSDVGIAVAEDSNNFTPASDAIIAAKKLPILPRFISMCRYNRRIVHTSFAISILYNCIGLCFAVQGKLSPLVAAILMPASSLSILIVTVVSTSLLAKRLKL